MPPITTPICVATLPGILERVPAPLAMTKTRSLGLLHADERLGIRRVSSSETLRGKNYLPRQHGDHGHEQGYSLSASFDASQSVTPAVTSETRAALRLICSPRDWLATAWSAVQQNLLGAISREGEAARWGQMQSIVRAGIRGVNDALLLDTTQGHPSDGIPNFP